jgi:hypothetical protein
VATRPFKQWADEWLAKKKVEKVKRGRIVAVRDPKTIEVLELRVGYVKDRFGKLCRQDIKRPDVLAFMRSYEAEGKLETRDRVRSIGEQICNYADVEGDAYIPQPVAALFRLRQTPHLHAPRLTLLRAFPRQAEQIDRCPPKAKVTRPKSRRRANFFL